MARYRRPPRLPRRDKAGKNDPNNYINDLKANLPLPSEVQGDLVIPHGIIGYNEELGTPRFGQIVFTKEYVDGIAIRVETKG